MFGDVLRNMRSGRVSNSLLSKLATPCDLGGINAVKWGREHEATAVKCFEQKAGLTVRPTGLWLHESGVLGASPDGIIGSGYGHLLEVKCPWRFREKSMRQELTGDNDYIVRYNDGNWILNNQHAYYHQVQGQLHISGLQFAVLVLYAPKQDLAITPITRQDAWEDQIAKLLRFFTEKYLPYAFPSCAV